MPKTLERVMREDEGLLLPSPRYSVGEGLGVRGLTDIQRQILANRERRLCAPAAFSYSCSVKRYSYSIGSGVARCKVTVHGSVGRNRGTGLRAF